MHEALPDRLANRMALTPERLLGMLQPFGMTESQQEQALRGLTSSIITLQREGMWDAMKMEKRNLVLQQTFASMAANKNGQFEDSSTEPQSIEALFDASIIAAFCDAHPDHPFAYKQDELDREYEDFRV
jgi:hypothetical protein